MAGLPALKPIKPLIFEHFHLLLEAALGGPCDLITGITVALRDAAIAFRDWLTALAIVSRYLLSAPGRSAKARSTFNLLQLYTKAQFVCLNQHFRERQKPARLTLALAIVRQCGSGYP